MGYKTINFCRTFLVFLWDRVFSKKFILERRIFNIIILGSMTASLLTTVYNVIIKIPIQQTFISAICFLFSCYIFILSEKKGNWRKLSKWLICFFPVALIVAWFYADGSSGSVPFFLFLVCTGGVLMLKRNRLIFILLVLMGIGVSLFIERQYPGMVQGYITHQQRFYDVVIGMFLCIIINTIIVFTVFDQYKKEQKQSDALLKQSIIDKNKLEDALGEIKTLKGIVPICSNCKKIRDDEGYWNILEAYIQKHSDASFSHSICPECSDKFYGEENWYIKMKNKKNDQK